MAHAPEKAPHYRQKGPVVQKMGAIAAAQVVAVALSKC